MTQLNFNIPHASATCPGIIETATAQEVAGGAATNVAVTPRSLYQAIASGSGALGQALRQILLGHGVQDSCGNFGQVQGSCGVSPDPCNPNTPTCLPCGTLVGSTVPSAISAGQVWFNTSTQTLAGVPPSTFAHYKNNSWYIFNTTAVSDGNTVVPNTP